MRFIFDHHDLSPEIYLAKGGQRDVFYKGLRLLEHLTLRSAHAVISTNESYRQVGIDRGHVAPERTFVVRSGPANDTLYPVVPDETLKRGYRYMVCYLGEMCSQDGVSHFLQVARHLIHDQGRRDISFTLLGGGPAWEDFVAMSRRLKLEPHVTFIGRVYDPQIRAYLSTADLCVNPDAYSEWADLSTMNKMMEYMVFGKPIVAFNLKENRFSAQDSAAYVPSGDAIQMGCVIGQLLDDPARRERMGQAGQRRLQEALLWDYSVPHLLAAYESVLT